MKAQLSDSRIERMAGMVLWKGLRRVSSNCDNDALSVLALGDITPFAAYHMQLQFAVDTSRAYLYDQNVKVWSPC
ncbi:hypothetical protein GGTG_07683 [Gaeumannomyces tritici R3-111a-1]|uniref:Uncharacterized protein n=1 Tax=Gaeumannomyces tritici (strain R3-111a-1) TaxID=644352 RepID=J3P2D6_GAET3|nr:hypothetical protein GGTG_07683 [Gaeumannomyces tritici R3-111a-1]EJT73828.1 hypothetical protein GGTG_07683 [Gaeumannomyces tritici R3-111a-1]